MEGLGVLSLTGGREAEYSSQQSSSIIPFFGSQNFKVISRSFKSEDFSVEIVRYAWPAFFEE